MTGTHPKPLRRGWTTGACATAAAKGAVAALWHGAFPERVRIILPRGETPEFPLADCRSGDGWAECGVVKDAGDDPDVTHGCTVVVRAEPGAAGIEFRAGEGVGTVTMPGLPVPVGEPAINPVPRQMMTGTVWQLAADAGVPADVVLTVSIPGGEAIAARTWNPRLGIMGGLSILGTTGVVRPFSCAAWIASIHRGIDVARATGLTHVVGCTGATSEAAVRLRYGLCEQAMLDMGDFAGGLLKYLARHPVPAVTIAGGIGKMTKLAQGARDLHSARSQVDMTALSAWSVAAGLPVVAHCNTALQALETAGPALAETVARGALVTVQGILGDAPIAANVVIVSREGRILADTGLAP